MSNLIVNIRIGVYHIQIERRFKYIRISKNDYFANKRDSRIKYKKIEVYDFLGFHR